MIAIPNMSKPKICYMCPLSDETYFCPIVGEAIPRANRKLESCPLIEIDLVRCGECKYQYMCGHQIKRNGLTLKLTCCEYGERRE